MNPYLDPSNSRLEAMKMGAVYSAVEQAKANGKNMTVDQFKKLLHANGLTKPTAEEASANFWATIQLVGVTVMATLLLVGVILAFVFYSERRSVANVRKMGYQRLGVKA